MLVCAMATLHILAYRDTEHTTATTNAAAGRVASNSSKSATNSISLFDAPVTKSLLMSTEGLSLAEAAAMYSVESKKVLSCMNRQP